MVASCGSSLHRDEYTIWIGTENFVSSAWVSVFLFYLSDISYHRHSRNKYIYFEKSVRKKWYNDVHTPQIFALAVFIVHCLTVCSSEQLR